MIDKEQISEVHDIILGVLIGSIKSYDAAIKIQSLVKESDHLEQEIERLKSDQVDLVEYVIKELRCNTTSAKAYIQQFKEQKK